jgi:hypothetical protein
MKCPNCGYYNLPSAQICGRCRRTLTLPDTGEKEILYPPRARDRNLTSQVRAGSRLVRRTEELARATSDQASRQWLAARENVRYTNQRNRRLLRNVQVPHWSALLKRIAPPLLSLIPGLGQLFERHYLRAVLFFAVYLFLLFFTIRAFHITILVRNVPNAAQLAQLRQLAMIPMILLALVWSAMLEAAWHSIPPAPGEKRNSVRRCLRLGLACAAVAGLVYSIIFSYMGMR